MKKKIYILLACLFLAIGQGKAQGFRQIIVSFAIRLPKAYPPSLPMPDPGNAGSIKPSDIPRYDSLANAYQKIIDQLKTEAPSIRRDTMMMGYLHDQILIRFFKLIISPEANDPRNMSSLISLSRQLGNLALQRKNQYYLWAGNIWEENALFNSGDIIKAFELAFKRAKLCDDCPECHQAPECYIALAQYYAEFKDTANTDLYFNKAFNSVSKIQEKVFTLREWASVYNKQQKPKKALEIIKRLNKLDKKPFDESWILKQKALAQVQLNQFDEALETTKLAIAKKTDEFKLRGILDSTMTDVYIREGFQSLFAAIYLGKNEPQKALGYANSPDFYDDLGESPDLILYRIYKALGKDKLALEHHELYVDYLKTFQNDDKKNELAILQRNYEVQKVQTIADYEKFRADNLIKNQVYLVIGLILLSVLLLLIYRNNLQKKRVNVLLKSQKEEIDLQREKAEKALSALKVTQAQLIQSEKLASLAELTAGVAHEIQNPLNFVNNFSELSLELADELKEEINRPEIDKAFLDELISDLTQNQERINHHGKRAASIVKGMLEHSSTSTGVPALSDINAIAEEYQRMAFHSYCAKDKDFKVTIETLFDTLLPKIEVIPQDIGRVLLNLINNAFYAVNEKAKQGIQDYSPTVTVTTKKLENAIEISVKDNGNGIPEAIKDKIFQPFFTTKPTGQGTGLGLSLAYDIVTKGHGGMLTVSSIPGAETTFEIQLPINATNLG